MCTRIDEYNRRAADLADQLFDIPEDIACLKEVQQVLYWDGLYRKEMAKKKYLQENRMLPEDEPVKDFRKDDYHVPAAGLALGDAVRNLAKNVSTWKKRIDDPRYPDAEQKHGMYTALYQEAKTKAAAERTRIQALANDARNNN